MGCRIVRKPGRIERREKRVSEDESWSEKGRDRETEWNISNYLVATSVTEETTHWGRK